MRPASTQPSTQPSIQAAHEALDVASSERLRRAAGAARELSDLLWDALHEELREQSTAGPRALRVAELSQRLADVAATVSMLGCAVVRDADATPADAFPGGSPFASRPSFASEPPFAVGQPLDGGPELAFHPASSVERPFEQASGSPSVVIVDERDDPVAPAPAVTSVAPEAPSSQIRPRPLPWDTPLSDDLRVTRSGEHPSAQHR